VRILLLHSRYRSGPASGENRVVEDEMRLLSEAGHEVDLFSPELDSVSIRSTLEAAIDTIWSRTAIAEVERRIERRRPDIVHCHNLFPMLSPGVLRAGSRASRVVLTLHNYRLMCLPGTFLRDGRVCLDCHGRATPWPGIVHSCYRGSAPASAVLASSLVMHRVLRTFERVSLFIAISRFVRERYVDVGFPADRVVVKPHFAWPTSRRQGPGTYFVYLGRLSEEKGVSTLLHAWEQLDRKLIVVGDGPERERLQRDAPPGIEFTGALDPERARKLLRDARAVLVPSIGHEAAGKVVPEAYAAGVPVIVSDLGGLPEIVRRDVTGVIVPARDVRAWIDGVTRLLDDGTSARMGQAAWELWSTRFSASRGIADLESAYARALAIGSPTEWRRGWRRSTSQDATVE
jgi:glycosyltransferase involved in cell wall biosynthesis